LLRNSLPALRNFSRQLVEQFRVCRKLILFFDQKFLKERPFGRITFRAEPVAKMA
jgi:hypothetical protein